MIRTLRALLCACLCFAAGLAGAQTLDDIDVRTQGDQKVVRLRFNASVSYITIAPSGSADQYLLRFEMLAADEPVLRQSVPEQRRLRAAEGLPDIGVVYTPEPANRIKQLSVRLSRAMPLQARQGPNARSIELLFSVKAPEAQAPAIEATMPAAAAAPEVEAQAQALMATARAALAEGRADEAARTLDQLLKLPPNSQSTEAQELIGLAWEAAQDPARARIEYTLYLKLYPQGEGAVRVGARLAALGGVPVAAAPAQPASAPPPAARSFSGSIAQYYYGGKARSESLVNIATGIDQATLSKTTESAIVTSFDLSGRTTNEGSETRAVLRGSGSKNLLKDGRSSSSVSAAYVDHRFAGGGAIGGLAVGGRRKAHLT
jgi:tetratricopeptide (TPR) repeat protein